MKMIQRYASYVRGTTVAAGLFTYTETFILTPQFNLTINRVFAGCGVKDNVTRQYANVSFIGQFTTGIESRLENPGITFSGAIERPIVFSTGGSAWVDMGLKLAAGDPITFASELSWAIVTANAFRVEFGVTLGYLCPADSLSVEGIIFNE